MKSKRRKIAIVLFAVALLALPLASTLVDSSTSQAIYVAGAATDEDVLRDVGTIYGGGAGILGALGVLCGVQLAVGLGIGL
ncbi:MAG: hypothetical protein HRU40_12090 [Saprospiraceae bacterium]|nr:hypothetical protein [Saprospiraceae bacterium]